ncbi:MAG: hemolysin III family protein [Bacteroidetes bacterium]|nr:hemolysin III family protein [Bacteroidota bacterium]
MSLAEHPYAENIVNSLTHGVGALIFLVLCPLLIATAVYTAYSRKIAGALIFSFGLLAVYFSSTLFHAMPDKYTKEILHYFDLFSIYLLISGTYTPFLLIYFRSKLGKFLLIVVWALTAVGITMQLVLQHVPFFYTLVVYLGMGWIGLLLVRPAILKLKPKALWLLFIGGLAYTSGTYFIYHDQSVWYYHAIWHVFVLVGSLCHFWSVYFALRDKVRN